VGERHRDRSLSREGQPPGENLEQHDAERVHVAALVDAVGESDEMLLDELDRLVRAKRRKLRREGR